MTTDDYDAAVDFYRDVLGMPVSAEYVSADQGRVVILDAGAATLEIGDPPHAEYVDAVEVGRRVAGHVRVALRVDDATRATTDATAGGAQPVAPRLSRRGTPSTRGSRRPVASRSRCTRTRPAH